MDVCSTSRHERQEAERFKAFDYADLIKRDKINLDIFWLKDDALKESAPPASEVGGAPVVAPGQVCATLTHAGYSHPPHHSLRRTLPLGGGTL